MNIYRERESSVPSDRSEFSSSVLLLVHHCYRILRTHMECVPNVCSATNEVDKVSRNNDVRERFVETF